MPDKSHLAPAGLDTMGSQDGAEDGSGGGSNGGNAEAPKGGRWGAAPASDALKAWRAATREVGFASLLHRCMSPSAAASLITHDVWQAAPNPLLSIRMRGMDALGLSTSRFGKSAARRYRRHNNSAAPPRPCHPQVHVYAYAAPNAAALEALLAQSPLLELGAGTGYWARLLRGAGADVLALDIAPPGPAAAAANTYHGRIPTVTEVSASAAQCRGFDPYWGASDLPVLLPAARRICHAS